MSKIVALLDSNVVIASVAAEHERHQASAALLNEFSPRSMYIRIPAIALVAIATAACGQEPNDRAYAREVAASVDSDCYSARSQAPDAAFAHHLDRLCTCVHDKVAATPMSRNDGAQARYEKIQTAMTACDKRLGGVPDAEDYRATGIQPPTNSSRH